MTNNLREEALETLERFVRGGASDEELEALVTRFEVPAAGDVLDQLSPTAAELRRFAIGLDDIAYRLSLYLSDRLEREKIFRWLTTVHGIVTSASYETSAVSSKPVATTLAVLSLLLDPAHPGSQETVRLSLEQVRSWLETGKPVPARTFLPRVFRSLGTIRLYVVENPLAFFASSRDQWIDVALRSVPPQPMGAVDAATQNAPRTLRFEDTMRLIPFSVFTHRFFRRELPALISRFDRSSRLEWGRGDSFYYHPENNRAISLRERYPGLRNCRMEFHYYIDESGLAEIILDTPAIGRSHLLFAARLFCLHNGIRRATLDGIKVSGTTVPFI